MEQVEVVFNDGTSSFHPIGNLNNVKRLFGYKITKINFPEESANDIIQGAIAEVKRGKKSATN
jgi:hypothetical protein